MNSEIHQFKPRARRMKPIPAPRGVTQEQAGEINRQFHEQRIAAPSITVGGHSYDTVIAVLTGEIWPGVRRIWLDRCWPCGGK